MLCSKCQNIHFQPLEQCDRYVRQPDRFAEETWFLNRQSCLVYFHHDSLDALRASADQGCHFCAILLGNSERDVSARLQHPEVILVRPYVPDDRANAQDANSFDWESIDGTMHVLCNGMRWLAQIPNMSSREHSSTCRVLISTLPSFPEHSELT